MKTPDFRQEEGQSLIQVALMLVVLIGFVGLALDGGNLYAERRRMQNAADAGALAGAWAMCKVNDPAAAKAKAAEYMQKNGDLDAAVGNVDIVGYKVTAHASKSVTPFLPFTFGGSVNVPANASAACGTANSSCGVWPLGFSESEWNTNLSEACSTGKEIGVWIDTGKDPQTSCLINSATVNGVCNCYQCSNGGEEFFLHYSTTSFAWLDYSQIPNLVTDVTSGTTGCGTDELADAIADTSGIRIAKDSCIAELSGARAPSNPVKSAIEARANDIISVILYDSNCTAAGCVGGTPRHVTDFGCVTVNDPPIERFKLKAKADAYEVGKPTKLLQDINNVEVLFLSVNCNGECDSACGSTDGTPPDPYGVNAANLVP